MRRNLVPTLAALCGTLMLAACGSSDRSLEEKLQRAEQAAQRAELAQQKAEKAAQKAVVYVEHKGYNGPDAPSPAERDMEKASQDPNSAYFDPRVNTEG